MKIFTEQELETELSQMQDWRIVNAAIEKKFLFKDFKQALGFMVQVGILAEQADHHPEILNIYNQVTIRLNTHSANAITDKDVKLAGKIDLIVN